MVITLDELKAHLNIESTFTEDDDKLTDCILDAQDLAAHEMDIHSEAVEVEVEVEDEDGSSTLEVVETHTWDIEVFFHNSVPRAVRRAVMILASDMYNHAESTTDQHLYNVPRSVESLLACYKIPSLA